MALYRKTFVFSILFLMSASSAAVASLDNTLWEVETPLLEDFEAKVYQKMEPCTQDKSLKDLEYRDCLIDAALFSLSSRSRNDSIESVFDRHVLNKLDPALHPGAAMKIAERAIDGLNNDTDVNMKSTYYEILKNLMSRIPDDKEDFRPVFAFIKNSKIEIPENVVKSRRDRGVTTMALSEAADIILAKKVSVNTTEVSE
jgi:hypothetical protein